MYAAEKGGGHMAITEKDILRITMKDTPYLLLRSPTHFHLIQVNSELTDKRFMRLLRIYPCGTKELEAMHLHVSAYKAENITFIHLHKTHTASTLELHRTLNQVNCTLDEDYSEDELRSFFEGYPLTVTTVPKPEISRSTVRSISAAVHLACAICTTIYLFLPPHSKWVWACLICQLPAILLPLWKPAFFSLTDFHWHRINEYNEIGNLSIAFLMPLAVLSVRVLSTYTYQDSDLFRIIALNLTVVLVAYIFTLILRPIIRLRIRKNICVLFFCGIFAISNLIHINYLLSPTPDAEYKANIVSIERRNTKHASYRCTVETPNGTEMEINLRNRDASQLSADDTMIVQYYEGTLNIPFYMYEIP